MEIASGTGEHASHFTESIPHLLWLPTELDTTMFNSIEAYAENTKYAVESDILVPPIPLDVLSFTDDSILPSNYRDGCVDFIMCINMIHISPIETTSALFNIASKVLRQSGIVYTYGPYRVNSDMAPSNVEFDASLRSRNPLWGIRDLEHVANIANEHGLVLENKIEMPSNNLSLIFRKL